MVATSRQTDIAERTRTRERRGTDATRAEAFGQRHEDTGKTSNSRLATVKLKEGRGEGQRPATGQSGGQYATE
jgi:hypothetical protein